MQLFFVGIGGIGISSLAQFCAQKGDNVSGSNEGKTPMFPYLEKSGVRVFDSHDAENINKDIDFLIYSEAIDKDNPERQRALSLGIPQKSYFEFLAHLTQDYKIIAVAGTHGKTTTTGLIAQGFAESGFDASVMLGSRLDLWGGNNFYLGSNDYLLLEACEYKNNFRFLKPEITIITSLELDHIDYYRDENHYFEAFRNFCDQSNFVLTFPEIWESIKSQSRLIKPQKKELLNLKILGSHNQENAQLALGLADFLSESLDVQKFRLGLENFPGCWRRGEFLGKKDGIDVFCDYGHHPTEIKKTLEGFRNKFPDKKIGLVFEPHQYSRSRYFFSEFLDSFNGADFIAMHPIYEARDTDEDKKSIEIDDFVAAMPKIQRVSNVEEAQNFSKGLNSGDILIFMGAGVIDTLAHNFIKK